MNESIAFAAGVVAYQSRLRAKLVLIERACGTVGSEGIAALDIRGRLVRFNCLARYHMDGQLIETGRAHPARTHIGQTFRRSFILGQRCATQFQRAAERLEEKNRTDHVLHKPDKLTCYLHEVVQNLDRTEVKLYALHQ